jgi:hypothetical protein
VGGELGYVDDVLANANAMDRHDGRLRWIEV